MNSNVNSWLSTTAGKMNQDCAIPVAINPIFLIPRLEQALYSDQRQPSVTNTSVCRLFLKSFEIDLGKMRAIVPAVGRAFEDLGADLDYALGPRQGARALPALPACAPGQISIGGRGQNWIGGDRTAEEALVWSSVAAGVSCRTGVVGGPRPAGRLGGSRGHLAFAAVKHPHKFVVYFT